MIFFLWIWIWWWYIHHYSSNDRECESWCWYLYLHDWVLGCWAVGKHSIHFHTAFHGDEMNISWKMGGCQKWWPRRFLHSENRGFIWFSERLGILPDIFGKTTWDWSGKIIRTCGFLSEIQKAWDWIKIIKHQDLNWYQTEGKGVDLFDQQKKCVSSDMFQGCRSVTFKHAVYS